MSNTEWLKEVTQRMIKTVGERKDVAHRLHVLEKEISLWCNPCHDRFIPIDHAMDLDALADDLFLKEWARKRGYELVAKKQVDTDVDGAITAAAELIKESGELSHDVIKASPDGFCPREKRELRAKMGEVYNRLHALDGALS